MNFLLGSLLKVRPFIIRPVQLPHLSFHRALPPVQQLLSSLPSPVASTAAAPEPTEPCRQYSGYTGAYQALPPVQLLHLSLPSPAASADAAPEPTEPFSIFTHTRLEKVQRKKSAARIRSWMITIITMIFIETKLHIRIGKIIKYRWLG